MRPTFEQIYMDLAKALSRRSTCARLQVGTVITSEDYRRVLAVGYNGNASGLKNRCDSDEVGNCGCLHGEMNAVINCDVSREVRKVVFVTHAPCKMCAKALVNMGNVVRVWYDQEYRKREGLELLEECGIPALNLDWFIGLVGKRVKGYVPGSFGKITSVNPKTSTVNVQWDSGWQQRDAVVWNDVWRNSWQSEEEQQ